MRTITQTLCFIDSENQVVGFSKQLVYSIYHYGLCRTYGITDMFKEHTNVVRETEITRRYRRNSSDKKWKIDVSYPSWEADYILAQRLTLDYIQQRSHEIISVQVKNPRARWHDHGTCYMASIEAWQQLFSLGEVATNGSLAAGESFEILIQDELIGAVTPIELPWDQMCHYLSDFHFKRSGELNNNRHFQEKPRHEYGRWINHNDEDWYQQLDAKRANAQIYKNRILKRKVRKACFESYKAIQGGEKKPQYAIFSKGCCKVEVPEDAYGQIGNTESSNMIFLDKFGFPLITYGAKHSGRNCYPVVVNLPENYSWTGFRPLGHRTLASKLFGVAA